MLIQFHKIPSEEAPLAERLVQELKEQYTAKPDSKIIIFVRTRELAARMKEMLAEKIAFIKSEYITSINTKSSDGGQTEQEQETVLKKFRSGECKALIATTVAEEGLDIESCNLVIKYNHVTNEIAMVQRRGRARARDSRAILLTTRSKIARKEGHNAFKEEVQDKTLIEICDFPPEEFKAQVQRLQSEYYMQLTTKDETKLKDIPTNKKYKLNCRDCGQFIVYSTHIKRAECHYVAADPTVWRRLTIKPFSSMDLEIGSKRAIECSCKRKIGNVIIYKDVYYPVISKDTFTLEEDNSPEPNIQKGLIRAWKQTMKYWKTCELSDFDRREMINSCKCEYPKECDTMTSLVNQARQSIQLPLHQI